MKSKKIFVLLTALALSLAACNMGGGNSSNSGNESKSSADTTSQSQSTDSSSSSQGGTDTVAVTALTLNKTELSIEATKSETLTVTVSPENASNTRVNWVSSDPTVATVSSLGKVSALKVGTATITVSSQSNPEVTATCAVTVTEEGGKYGSLNKPKTVAEALAITAEECKEDGDATAGEIYIKGIVTKNPSYNSEKGYASNIYLKDALTDEKDILVYTADCDLLKFPYQNDTVILHGYVKNYKGTIEFATVTPKGATKGVNPAIDSVTRGTSSISYSVTNGTVNADAPKSGKNNSEFTFRVTPAQGYVVNSVSINGEAVTAQADGSYKSYVRGNTAVLINIFEEGVEIANAVMKYSGETTNMTGGNDAAMLNLDATLFEVVSDNPTGLYAGLNVNGGIRLYNGYNNTADRTLGTTLTISSRRATVKKIIVTLHSDTVAGLDKLEVKAGGQKVDGTADGIYDFSSGTFTLKNVSNAEKSDQLRILNVAIYYSMNQEVKAEAIAVAPKTAEVEAGEEVKLGATLTPANSTDVPVWSSSDPTKATVDQTGKVTGVAEGEVTITAKISDTIVDTATVTVTPAKVINYGTAEAPLTVAQAKAVLDEYPTKTSKQQLFVKGIVSSSSWSDQYKNFEIWLQSDDGTNAKEFELYSTVLDESITTDYKAANALKDLEVVARGYGKIYRDTYELTNNKVKDASGNESTVYPTVLSVATPAIKSLSLNKETLNLTVGGEETLVVSKNPANGTGTVVWESSEPTIATVDQEGKVTAVAAGEAVITAKVSDDIKVTCAVTVAAAAVAAESVTLDKETLELYVGYEGQLAATVAPENATGAPVWESSDPTKATVDQTGKVTAVAVGTAVITATHGQVSDSCTVTVSELNLGSLEAPITPAAALKIAANLDLKAGDFSPAKAYVQGTVEYATDNFYNGAYFGKWNVVDGENKLYVVNSKDNTPEVYAGDTVVVSGYLSYEAANGYELLKKDNNNYPKVEKATARATGTISVDAEIANAEVQELSAASGLNGSNFTFKVVPADGYKVVSVKVKNGISALDQTLTAAEGVYTGVVKGNVTIYVETAVDSSTPLTSYTLDGSVNGTGSGYADLNTASQNGIEWKINGNLTMNPWRIGGKSLDGVDRVIYSQNAMNVDVKKIVITFGAASSITVNSLNVGVYSTAEKAAAGGIGDIANFTPEFVANDSVTITKTGEQSWLNRFYNITLNVTVSGSSNRFVQLVSVEFLSVVE